MLPILLTEIGVQDVTTHTTQTFVLCLEFTKYICDYAKLLHTKETICLKMLK